MALTGAGAAGSVALVPSSSRARTHRKALTMNTRHTSLEPRLVRPILCQVGAVLALAATACSSSSDSATATTALPPSSLSPAMEPNATSMPPELANTPTPSAAPAGGAAPAPSPAEGQQATGLPMAPATAPGGGGPTAPASEMSGELEPGAESTAEGPLPAVPSAGCGRSRALQDGTQTIASGGMDRSYFLETPEAYDNTHPYRVVFMFHWNYG